MIGQGGVINFLAPGRHEITHATKTPTWLIFGVVSYLKVCSRYVDLFSTFFVVDNCIGDWNVAWLLTPAATGAGRRGLGVAARDWQ